ncbi:hypothetical protein [Blastococcus sp. KM273129]|uniref:hypothetical protein n=1 Tax=Blastococcus sp. KM273129 TaxID=2570315 RepID=UPI001F24A5EA|nr:hypothetical protein [Blastococcus sp. KM273129]MCF6734895.1 hypothetical protein [Blastococcus sp. KM273129]
MRCRSQNCTREAETAWITDRITPEGRNEQLPVCGQHLVRLANREPVEWRPEDEERPAESEWVVRVVLRDAPELYYGEGSLGGRFTRFRGSAYRFHSEESARFEGYQLKEQLRNRIIDFTVEEITRPRRVSPKI